jgi:hypothetical protein
MIRVFTVEASGALDKAPFLDVEIFEAQFQ